MLHLVGIVLLFHRQTDLTFFETIEDFRYSDALGAIVFDRTDDAALGDDETDNPSAIRTGLTLQLQVIKVPSVPQRHKVTLQYLFVVLVTLASDDTGTKGFLWDTTGATKLHSFDNVFG